MSPDAIRAKIMTMAARPSGISRKDTARSFSMLDRTQARAMLDKFEAAGELFGVLHPHQRKCSKPKTRLFTTPEAAGAWCVAPYPGAVKVQRVMRGQLHDAREAIGTRHPKSVMPPQSRSGMDRGPRAGAQPAHQGPVKFTPAVPFVDRRFVPDVVPAVVNPNECSAWARAATERRAA